MTTKIEQKIKVIQIGNFMISMHQLPPDFVMAAVETALVYEGVADLMELWWRSQDIKECELIVNDIKEMIKDCNTPPRQECIVKLIDEEGKWLGNVKVQPLGGYNYCKWPDIISFDGDFYEKDLVDGSSRVTPLRYVQRKCQIITQIGD